MHRRNLLSLAPLLAAPRLLGAQPQPRLMRTLPRGGRPLPVIGMGTWLTFDVGDDNFEQQRRLQVLQRFFAAGGGLIDSSPMYGRAERLVGELLPQVLHDGRLISATKVWTPFDALGPGQLESSLKLWRLPRLDVVLVHNLLNWRVHLKLLRQAQEQGRVLNIGISTSHGSKHDEAERVLRSEPIDVLQITYNLADTRAESLISLAAERGVAVVVNRPFDGGSLFGRVRGRPLPGWAADIGCATWAAFFLKWIVAHPAVGCAIPATTQPGHMDENMRAGIGPLPDAAMRRRMLALVAGF